ncbi:hypothetical protein Snoj_01310 [Streptomyces nojiriensis]|uniref:HEAT repeat domain-containing protein n=1 Tax=Streptomyces nojiriensis TaxID=66374 RepID=A0ABQ3SDK3_9ACTN|nr:hypothetical protein [Streptomyces nojiriensis]QTI42351.1 hypothetical protein JYK04_00108 [Streptomyces nojiriensis]GGS34255.1 hypothetical protein GCM10010205_75480 [Streptomyces nojiriensis]GHI66213.1 hypothetical protein Snoj_01310 [Streptomyces nojiriensis]
MIFKRKRKASGLTATVSELEEAVAARDGDRTERAFTAVMKGVQSASDPERVLAGARLAALLPAFPPTGPRPMLAMAAGFCVERGADPVACAEPILDSVHRDLLDALEFARRWTATGAAKDELPEPDEKIIDDALLARLGGDVHEATLLALAWCSVEEWQPPALAVLCRSAEVRRRHASAILPTCRDLAALERHDLKCLAYALAVLDDEPLVVLHRPTGTGFEIRIGGIGDNFQLHTLLAHVLIGGGHVPGTRPSAESVRLATDPEPAQGRTRAIATGAFELLAPDGERIWNEGLPDDIPVVEGRRLLVLDEPAYQRSWDADRFFPHLPGTADLARVLTADETRAWLARTSPSSLIRRPS